ncbi:MAG: ArnT family glycosyltransferase [Planctomycetota bacterium]|jgi:hypothetical protein
MKYERLCERIASPGAHNIGFFLSTAFLGPVGLYVWESREGRGWLGRAWRGVLAWAMLLAALRFFLPFGFVIALPTLAIGRPLRWLLRVTRLSRRRETPDVPRSLTFEIRILDVASLVFISVIFLVMVANRDELARMDMVTDSDPTYHMAVAKQIITHKGRLPEWDYWEYAPFGRPHLYHPALHYLIAFFSWKTGDVVHGFNTLQMLLYPLALLGGWYFARWLFGAAGGFLSLIFLSMGMFYLVSQAMAMPAALVTALIPPILMAFLAKRTRATVLLLTVALYTHGPVGVPQLVVLGLLVFSMRYREWFPFFRKVSAFAGLLYLPWVVRLLVLDYPAWFGTSSGAMGPAKDAAELVARGLLQLQIINPILLLLAFRIWWRDRDERLGVVRSLLVGFLPMLFAYGGRFFMHTWPLWAMLVARNFEAWLSRPEAAAEAGDATARRSLRRRSLAFVALAFAPLPVITIGMPGAGRVRPIPCVTGLNASFVLALVRTEPDRDFDRMAARIRKLMCPSPPPSEPPRHEGPPFDGKDPPTRKVGEKFYDAYLEGSDYAELRRGIVHIGTDPGDESFWADRLGSMYFGDRIVAATGCRVDTGGWGPEVRSPLMQEEVARAREEDPACLFAFQKKGKGFTDESVPEALRKRHRLDWIRRFGTHYLLGGRGIAEEPVEEF